jgi:hypothetical protein
MIDWWLGFVHTTDQYKLWHPKDHMFSDWDHRIEIRGNGVLISPILGRIESMESISKGRLALIIKMVAPISLALDLLRHLQTSTYFVISAACPL